MLHNSGKFQHLYDIFSCKINNLTVRQTYGFGTEIFAQSLVFPEVFLRKFRRERLSNKRLFRDKKNAHQSGHFATKCRSQGSESVLEAGLPDCPLIDHVRPILKHCPALIAVLGLVVDGANPLLFVRKALLDPVSVIARLM